MGIGLRILLFIFSLTWFFIVASLLRKNKIPVKYSLIWFLSAFVIFIVSLFPNALIGVMNFLGFKTISNMVIGIILGLLLLITIILTTIISQQNTKIILLIQEISLLKEKVEVKNGRSNK